MAKINKTQYIILGFLQDKSLTGYEIGELIKESTSYFWQESDASIYPTLKRLADDEKVTSTTVLVGKRKKEVFTITPLGKQAFEEWFKVSPAPSIQRDEFLLKLFFTTPATEKDMYKHCEYHARGTESVLETFKKIEQMLVKEFPDKPFWLKTLQNGIAHVTTEKEWLQKLKQGLTHDD